ncbi:glutathione S-transferase family protein [Bradyrhizobium jicamae]|uniref:glutathione S-transferase family protein n=1 Tax=Bradyrhizobium jicamae TaxID=280332 RepID=UPI001BA7BF5D|nr:glutathione S-transferase family protein [Bradyrhizobium jicamae]MBR0755331.1 glutathione S-transferase family protein [Bradyrhizobium jicamae]
MNATQKRSDQITLYMCPDSCSRVTINALEEAGLDYDLRLIDLLANEQRSPAYLAVNPKGKVPALTYGDHLLTENPAILHWIDRHRPQARLLPPGEGAPIEHGLMDLIWCSSTLHPMVRQIHLPSRFTDGETEGIKRDGLKKFDLEVQRIADRLAGQDWWYGDHWSIVDVYLHWLYNIAASGGFPLDAYPSLRDHAQRVSCRASYAQSLERERSASRGPS